jgi:hypothetical protein
MAELVLLIMLIKQPYAEDAQAWAEYCALAMESFEWMMPLHAASQYHLISKHFIDEWKTKPGPADISGGKLCDEPGGSNYSRVLSHRQHTNPGRSALSQTKVSNGLKVKTEPTRIDHEPVFDSTHNNKCMAADSSFNPIPSHPNRVPLGGSLSTETYYSPASPSFSYFPESVAFPIMSHELPHTTTWSNFGMTMQSSSGELDQGVLTGNDTMEFSWANKCNDSS